jgi:hypothetical protein
MSQRTGRPTRTTQVVLDSSLPADIVLAAAYDFTERRISIWPAVQRRYYRVHSIAGTYADVTEGTRILPGLPWHNWERCDYDWSRPGEVVATMTESNYAVSPSAWEMRTTPTDGGCRVEMIWTRTFTDDRRGRFFDFLFHHFGRSLFRGGARKMLRRLERAEARDRAAAA